jgi:hypothetical protein
MKMMIMCENNLSGKEASSPSSSSGFETTTTTAAEATTRVVTKAFVFFSLLFSPALARDFVVVVHHRAQTFLVSSLTCCWHRPTAWPPNASAAVEAAAAPLTASFVSVAGCPTTTRWKRHLLISAIATALTPLDDEDERVVVVVARVFVAVVSLWDESCPREEPSGRVYTSTSAINSQQTTDERDRRLMDRFLLRGKEKERERETDRSWADDEIRPRRRQRREARRAQSHTNRRIECSSQPAKSSV